MSKNTEEFYHGLLTGIGLTCLVISLLAKLGYLQ